MGQIETVREDAGVSFVVKLRVPFKWNRPPGFHIRHVIRRESTPSAKWASQRLPDAPCPLDNRHASQSAEPESERGREKCSELYTTFKTDGHCRPNPSSIKLARLWHAGEFECIRVLSTPEHRKVILRERITEVGSSATHMQLPLEHSIQRRSA